MVSLIANSGIQQIIVPLEMNMQSKECMWFHEWYCQEENKWVLELIYELKGNNNIYYYRKKDLFDKGYLVPGGSSFTFEQLKSEGIFPIRIDDKMQDGVSGIIYKMSMSDRNFELASFENTWMPIPYFFKRTEKKYSFGSFNWSRFKMVPKESIEGKRQYDVILAFDTRVKGKDDEYKETPVFRDEFSNVMNFGVCSNEFQLMDYCKQEGNYSYIGQYIFKLVHPDIQDINSLKGENQKRMSYIASYIFLINYIAKNNLFPNVTIYKDIDVEVKNIDMIIDIGNSSTTALLVEDNFNFNQIRRLGLTDYTNPIAYDKEGNAYINQHNASFDMRLAFRKVSFGDFGPKDSKQFVYPSLVRLGEEANNLIHQTVSFDGAQKLSTYSSPKRYLWDDKPNKEEWQYLVLQGESDDHILYLPGITDQLSSDGKLDLDNIGGSTHHYSRRSLMTFAFLEMLVQAHTYVNQYEYRNYRQPLSMPRKIKRIIVTCPTAMSKLERENLVKSLREAVVLWRNFTYTKNDDKTDIEIVPPINRYADDPKWYYDEATCAQLVYMYGEVGYKYKGNCNEFFDLYGKKKKDGKSSLTVASLDIGAGTTDLMISNYEYNKGDITTITPNPIFYDSFYFAGDDMLKSLIKNVMLLDEGNVLYRKLRSLGITNARQKMKDFFGPDHGDQAASERILRRDFNIQYSLPLMCYFLELTKNKQNNCVVHYNDVFSKCPPNPQLIEDANKYFGFDIATLEWEYDFEKVNDIITKEFEPILKKIATVMFAQACDIVILTGRPASLPAIHNIFLKYYPVSPDRLILLNGYYVGDWWPFGNNTGYILDSKTIVSMGAALAYYASELSSLNKFTIDLSKLNEGLKPTSNYVESSNNSNSTNCILSPNSNSGEFKISSIPSYLNVKQVNSEMYPSRILYVVDYDRVKIADRIRCDANSDIMTESKLNHLVEEEIDRLRRLMPYILQIERDPDDFEHLIIESAEDKTQKELHISNLDIHIQSIGATERYWLDTGEFEF
ncbi:MAG: virulence factor SrfB [Bacteroidales bacterium]|nr:virulence factor SrfB [Bacteroidales bacterium]